MPKSTIRILVIVAVVCRILGYVISPAAHTTASAMTGVQSLVGLFFLLAWLVLLFSAIIGALVKTAQLKKWGWFASLFFILPVFVYIFLGPADHKLIDRAYQPAT